MANGYSGVSVTKAEPSTLGRVATTNGSGQGQHLVVRVRLGIDYDSRDVDPVEFLDHVAKRLREATAEAGAELDVLQVGVAGDPRWQAFGPDNRVEGRPIP